MITLNKLKSLILFLFASFGMILMLSACSNQNSSSNNDNYSSRSTSTTRTKKDGASLIVYFSMSGTTEEAAKQIQKNTGAKIFRITAKRAYPNDYDGYARRGDYERRHSIHPAIKNRIPDWSKYKTVYVGFPTWWQQPPMIIHTLFDDYSFKGKTIVPFTTSMSTPMSSSIPYIRRMASKDGARVLNGFRYDQNPKEVKKILQNNNLIN